LVKPISLEGLRVQLALRDFKDLRELKVVLV